MINNENNSPMRTKMLNNLGQVPPSHPLKEQNIPKDHHLISRDTTLKEQNDKSTQGKNKQNANTTGVECRSTTVMA